jgi:hypothetical protein
MNPTLPIVRQVFSNMIELNGAAYNEIRRFVLPSVDVGAVSLPIELPVQTYKGILTEFKIESESSDYTVSLVAWPSAKVPSIDMIFQAKAISKVSLNSGLYNLFCKVDGKAVYSGSNLPEESIYLVIDNTAGDIATGVTALEIVYLIHV